MIAWTRPPSRHPNPKIRALRNARDNRDARAILRPKAGGVLLAEVIMVGGGWTTVREVGEDRLSHFKIADLETVETVVFTPGAKGERRTAVIGDVLAPEPAGAVCQQCAVRMTDQETRYSRRFFGQDLCRPCLIARLDRIGEGASA